MFKGTYHYKVDRKGRLPVPAPFRKSLSNERRLVVTVLDECLAIYPLGEWNRLEDQLRQLPSFSKNVKALTRSLTSRAVDCELDSQGRILIPPRLRAEIRIERDAILIGVLDRFEVWAPDRWQAFLRDSERILDDVSLDIQWPGRPARVEEAKSGSLPMSHPQEKPKR